MNTLIHDETDKIARLVAMGGKEWKGGTGEHRVYFKAETANGLAGIEKLPNHGYRFAGETISTYRFKEISLGDFHYDVIAGAFQCSGRWNKETFAAAVKEINRQLAEAPDATTAEKMEAVSAIQALDDEKNALDANLSQLQRDAEALTGGESDPAYPGMAARYDEITARLEAIKSERFSVALKLKALS